MRERTNETGYKFLCLKETLAGLLLCFEHNKQRGSVLCTSVSLCQKASARTESVYQRHNRAALCDLDLHLPHQQIALR